MDESWPFEPWDKAAQELVAVVCVAQGDLDVAQLEWEVVRVAVAGVAGEEVVGE